MRAAELSTVCPQGPTEPLTGVEKGGPVTVQMGERGSDPLDNGRTQAGYPRSRHELQLDDLVTYQGSEGRVRELVSIGILRPAAGGGFEWASKENNPSPFPQGAADRQQQGQQAPEQQQQESEPAARLSEQAEGVIKDAVSKIGPQAVSGLMSAIIEGKEKAVTGMTADFASRMGLESDQMAGVAQSVTREFSEQARLALGMSPETFQAFADEAWERDPNTIRAAIEAQVDKGQLGPLKKLGATFMKSGAGYDDASLENAELGEGVRVWRDSASGKLVLSARGQSMWRRDAIRHGVVKVSKRR